MPDQRNIATNRRARYDYFIEDRIEAGLVLRGAEVKSLRQHKVSLVEGYARIEKGEVWLHDVHIAPYEKSNRWGVDPLRSRKLLLHKREILRLRHRTEQKGYTLIPLRMYFRDGYAKVELGLCRGKRQYDRRRAIAERDERRDLERQLSERSRE
ncbi:MAG: SsrA-binding protein SmpB [Armatimonadota bacterium]|jgi:SsrA-binding protein